MSSVPRPRHPEPSVPPARIGGRPSGMSLFDRLAWLATGYPRRVLGLAAVVSVLLVPYVSGVFDELAPGGLFAPGGSATKAEALLDEEFPDAPPNSAIQVITPSGVDGATATRLGREVTEQIGREPGVKNVLSYWAGGGTSPLLRSKDRRSALILFRLIGSETEVQRRIDALHHRYAHDGPGVRLRFGGAPAVMRDVTVLSRKDLQRAELMAAPLVLVVLLLAFGGVVPALLPVLVGGVAVITSMALLRLLAGTIYISVFSLNLTTGLGFALAVDYSLFILRRFREEQSRGAARTVALRASLRTAGRTVLFSGLTVALSLTGALLFPLPYLRSYAYAGVGVVMAAEVAALVVLPALIIVLGDRLDKRRRGLVSAALRGAGGGRRGQHGARPERITPGRPAGSRWAEFARRVMARPLLFSCAAIALLLVLAAPIRHLRVAVADDTVLPASTESRLVDDAIRHDFAVCLPCQIPIVVPGVDGRDPATARRLSRYGSALSAQPGVARVDTAQGSFAHGEQISPALPDGKAFLGVHGGEWLSLWPTDSDQLSMATKETVTRIHATPPPYPVRIGGLAPHLLETKDMVIHSLPKALAVVVLSTFVLLFLFTGSVLLPLKALVLNALNLAAVLGVMVLVFQDGHLLSLFGESQATGTLELTTPVLIFCIAFGLSMDYEVFLLARIREEYLRRGDNKEAIASGLGATGPLLTYAGLAVVLVMIGIATSRISMVTMAGVGLALAVFLDITIIRAILVPSFMVVAGDLNWWAPAFLRGLHSRFGLREAEVVSDTAGAAGAGRSDVDILVAAAVAAHDVMEPAPPSVAGVGEKRVVLPQQRRDSAPDGLTAPDRRR
jgi:putative drug exporter of the RND superfamily